MPRPGGATLWFRSNIGPIITGGEITTAIFISHDITERKDADDALRESEERYRVLVEMMNEGLILQDANRIITYVNARLCEISGFDREELIGHHYDEFTAERTNSFGSSSAASSSERISGSPVRPSARAAWTLIS